MAQRMFKINKDYESSRLANDLICKSRGFIIFAIKENGDVYFRNPPDFLDNLPGIKTLIMGNHDKRNRKVLLKYFKEIYQFGVEIRIDRIPIVLCHYCMRVWNKSHYNSWHLYGHSHGCLSSIGKAHDVGVDNNKFSPLSYPEIKSIMETKMNNFNWVADLPGYNREEFEKEKEKHEKSVP